MYIMLEVNGAGPESSASPQALVLLSMALYSQNLLKNLKLLTSRKEKGMKKTMPPFFKDNFPEENMMLLLLTLND